MGQGVGQGGRVDGPQEAFAPGGTQAVLAEALGGREDLFLALSEQEDEQRLRASAREFGSLHLRGDEPPDGQEIGSLMRLVRQFLETPSLEGKEVSRVVDEKRKKVTLWEAAEYLGLTPGDVQDMVERGVLEADKFAPARTS